MAMYGLQTWFIDTILNNYFCGKVLDFTDREVYIGLGLEQKGGQNTTQDFSEVFDGRPLGNYCRERIIFGKAEDGRMTNLNDVIFATASEDWTSATSKISMIGLFDRLDYQDTETTELVKPMVVLPLSEASTALKGETIVLTAGIITLALTDE